MTNKATDMQSASREKPRLTTTRSAPASITTTSSKMQVQRRHRTKQLQQPKISSINLRCSFPNEACVDIKNNNVIDSIAEPYLVPITTNKTLKQVTKAKKVALLPSTGQSEVCSQRAVWQSSRRLVPPPRHISRNSPGVKLTKERVSFVTQDKLTQSKRRELAYLVVDLSTARERKKSFDDLDVELELRSAREDRSSLTRSNTVSGRIKAPKKSSQDRTQMTTPTLPKRGVRKWPPSYSSSGSVTAPNERRSNSSNTDSGGTAESASDLSSDAFLSSNELPNDLKRCPRSSKQPIKHKSFVDPRKRRAPPPPPNTLPRSIPPPPYGPANTLPRSIPPPPYGPAPTLLTPPQHMRSKSPSLSLQSRRFSGTGTDTKSKVHTLGKSNSITQLSGGRPFVRPRPPNIKTKPKPKLKESRSTSQVQAKVRPTISSPHLISSTKSSVPSKPVSGPFRCLPSPPVVSETIPTQTHLLHTTTNDGFNSAYEEVDFSPPSPSFPVPPPRLKRDQRRQSKNLSGTKTKTTQKPPFLFTSQNSKSPSQSLSSSQRKWDSGLSSEPCAVPIDYLEPVPSGEMRESDEDEPVGDYVDMGPGVLTEWTQSRGTVEHDRPEDCYVDMQPGLDPFANDKPEPIYIEMNSQEFVRAPPEKLESLYYATKDLFLNRKDLQVQGSSKRNKNT